MILLLGKNDAVERYAKEVLNIDMDNDIVYYPDITTHYSELSQYIDIAKEEEPPIITTQNTEMLDVLLHSDLEFKVITAYVINGSINARVIKDREEALYAKEMLKLELR